MAAARVGRIRWRTLRAALNCATPTQKPPQATARLSATSAEMVTSDKQLYSAHEAIGAPRMAAALERMLIGKRNSVAPRSTEPTSSVSSGEEKALGPEHPLGPSRRARPVVENHAACARRRPRALPSPCRARIGRPPHGRRTAYASAASPATT